MMTMSRMIVPAMLAMLLAGCGILPEKTSPSLYAPRGEVKADPAWPKVTWQLEVTRPTSDRLIDSSRILVRPTGTELQVYKGALWTQPVPDAVQDAVVRTLEDCRCIAGVARSGAGIAGDVELLLDIRRFDADYAGGATPGVVIEIGAKLISIQHDAVIGTETFRVDAPSSGTSTDAVAQAFDSAMQQATTQIVGWTLRNGRK